MENKWQSGPIENRFVATKEIVLELEQSLKLIDFLSKEKDDDYSLVIYQENGEHRIYLEDLQEILNSFKEHLANLALQLPVEPRKVTKAFAENRGVIEFSPEGRVK